MQLKRYLKQSKLKDFVKETGNSISEKLYSHRQLQKVEFDGVFGLFHSSSPDDVLLAIQNEKGAEATILECNYASN